MVSIFFLQLYIYIKMQVSVDTDCHFVEWVLWGKELNQEASSKNDHS